MLIVERMAEQLSPWLWITVNVEQKVMPRSKTFKVKYSSGSFMCHSRFTFTARKKDSGLISGPFCVFFAIKSCITAVVPNGAYMGSKLCMRPFNSYPSTPVTAAIGDIMFLGCPFVLSILVNTISQDGVSSNLKQTSTWIQRWTDYIWIVQGRCDLTKHVFVKCSNTNCNSPTVPFYSVELQMMKWWYLISKRPTANFTMTS